MPRWNGRHKQINRRRIVYGLVVRQSSLSTTQPVKHLTF